METRRGGSAWWWRCRQLAPAASPPATGRGAGSGSAVASLPQRPDLAARAKDGAEVGREAEQKLEDVAGAVVGGGHGGQHQAPGQQGDMAGGIDIVLD